MKTLHNINTLAPIAPIFIRINDMDTMFGLGRTTTYSLINSNAIRSKVVKEKHASRGIRLIEYSSVLNYINGLED